MELFDVVGVGFGPANISLAIAAHEAGTGLKMRFLERNPCAAWQSGMLLDGSDIQNHPLRDMVTLRNPRSRFTFVNYLHEAGRLLEHLNLPGTFPLRKEYAGYIRWAADAFADQVDYGVAVRSVSSRIGPDGDRIYAVRTTCGRELLSRSVVVGPGRSPYVPPPFDRVASPRVFHLTRYLPAVAGLTPAPRDIAIVGGSQSAVEIALDLQRRLPEARVTLYVRAFGLRLKDTSPFSEEGFFPAYTDYYYALPRARKRALDDYMRTTNYSSVDGDVLEQLYGLIYEQRLDGEQRMHVRTNSRVSAVEADDDGVHLEVRETNTGGTEHVTHDAVVLATGFRDIGPAAHQDLVPPLIAELAADVQLDADGYLAVEADYRVRMKGPEWPPLFLNGLCESTHGIGDAGSFSLLSLRAQTILGGLERSVPGSRA